VDGREPDSPSRQRIEIPGGGGEDPKLEPPALLQHPCVFAHSAAVLQYSGSNQPNLCDLHTCSTIEQVTKLVCTRMQYILTYTH
jgi:hypothetical protein